jgi:hypothetical protein
MGRPVDDMGRDPTFKLTHYRDADPGQLALTENRRFPLAARQCRRTNHGSIAMNFKIAIWKDGTSVH